MNLISRLINRSGLRISHSKVFSSDRIIFAQNFCKVNCTAVFKGNVYIFSFLEYIYMLLASSSLKRIGGKISNGVYKVNLINGALQALPLVIFSFFPGLKLLNSDNCFNLSNSECANHFVEKSNI